MRAHTVCECDYAAKVVGSMNTDLFPMVNKQAAGLSFLLSQAYNISSISVWQYRGTFTPRETLLGFISYVQLGSVFDAVGIMKAI